MAQDFGDDTGKRPLNFVLGRRRNCGSGRAGERAFDWWQRHYKKGNTPERPQKQWLRSNPREQVISARALVLPRKSPTMRRYAARMVPYAAAYTDKQGKWFPFAFAQGGC